MDDSKINKDNISEMSKNTQQENKSNEPPIKKQDSKRQSKDNISEFSKKSKNTNGKYNPQNDLSDTSELQLDNLSQKYSQDKFNSEQLFNSSDINKINKDQFNYIDNSSPEYLINNSIKNFKEISKEEKRFRKFIFRRNKKTKNINDTTSSII